MSYSHALADVLDRAEVAALRRAGAIVEDMQRLGGSNAYNVIWRWVPGTYDLPTGRQAIVTYYGDDVRLRLVAAA